LIGALLLPVTTALSFATAQDHADLQSMYFVHGTCTRLVTPDGDETPGCNKAVGLISYSNGRRSFWFSIPKKSLIAFSGMSGGSTTLQLDLLTIASTPDAIRGGAGQGSCSFSDPWKGIARIRCKGSSEAGAFEAEFTTDGKPPENMASH
jgi:hypothetical protein